MSIDQPRTERYQRVKPDGNRCNSCRSSLYQRLQNIVQSFPPRDVHVNIYVHEDFVKSCL